MVKRAIRAVAKRLSPKPEKVPERRLLVIIRAIDGDLVLQKKHDDHQPRHHYETEAKTLLQSVFPSKPKKFCAKTKADDALHEVLDFRRTGDVYVKPHFEKDNIEWHPVILDISWLFDVEFIRTLAKKGRGMKSRILTPLPEHPFAEKLQRLYPRN